MNTEEHQEQIRRENIETCDWELDALEKQLARLRGLIHFWKTEKKKAVGIAAEYTRKKARK